MENAIINILKNQQSIKNIAKKKISSTIYDAIVLAYTLKGQIKKTGEELDVFTKENANIAQILTADIMQEFRSLRLSEIPMLFKLGVQGKLGETYGLNYESYYRWIYNYYNSDIRRSANTEYLNNESVKKNQLLLSEKNQISEKEKRDIIIAGINNSYSLYLQNKHITNNTYSISYKLLDLGNAKRNFLLREGHIANSETLIDFFNRCKQQGLTQITL